jgi:hypothetical protein
MSQTQHRPHADDDAPIELFFGNLHDDFGSAVISKLFLRFWPYLSVNGEQLNETDFALLVQVIGLHQDGELRVSNLPLKACQATRERTKAKLRRMGLVFTQRIYYYPHPVGKTPVMKCQRWDLRGLTHNLAQVAREWQTRNAALLASWESAGAQGRRPIYTFPDDFRHEVVLFASLAMDIEKKLFYPVPETWVAQANTLIAELRTGINPRGTQRTDTNPRGRRTDTNPRGTARTSTNPRGHLIEDDEDDDLFAAFGGEKSDFSPNIVIEHFSRLRGKGPYRPSPRDREALQKLATEGISSATMIAGIERVAVAGKLAQARSITYCFPEIRLLAAGSVPALDFAPKSDSVSTGDSAPQSSSDLAGSVPEISVPSTTLVPSPDSAPHPLGIPVHEIPENIRITFAQLFSRYPTDLECNQLHWLCKNHERQAQERGEDAWDWVLKAIQSAEPEAKKPVAYVRKVLEQQQKSGPRTKATNKHETHPPAKALAVAPQANQLALAGGQTLKRAPQRSGYIIPGEISQNSLADAVAALFPDLILKNEE